MNDTVDKLTACLSAMLPRLATQLDTLDLVRNFIEILKEQEDQYELALISIIDKYGIIKTIHEHAEKNEFEQIKSIIGRIVTYKFITSEYKIDNQETNILKNYISNTHIFNKTNYIVELIAIHGYVFSNTEHTRNILESKILDKTENVIHYFNNIETIKHEIDKKTLQLNSQLESYQKETESIISRLSLATKQGYDNLAKSFDEFKKKKNFEIAVSLTIMFIIGVLTIVATLSALLSDAGILSLATKLFTQQTNQNTPNSTINYANSIHDTITIFLLDGLLIYFFRIALHNYYSARDELLQLETRAALCRFAPTYAAFTEGKACQLSDFAKHVFSPMTTRNATPPQPTDIIIQMAEAAKNLTPLKKP